VLWFSLEFITPRKRERDAFRELGTRVLYSGSVFDGPNFLTSTSFKNDAFFHRFWHLQIRLEANDVDRSKLIRLLKEFHSLTKLEIVAGDPLPQTETIIEDALIEFQTELPNVSVTRLP
jgi:hypothetical protein